MQWEGEKPIWLFGGYYFGSLFVGIQALAEACSGDVSALVVMQMCTKCKLWWSSWSGSFCLQACYNAFEVTWRTPFLMCTQPHVRCVLFRSPFTSASVLMKFFGWWGRLPVIQSLVADVRQTTEALLAQLLQRLQSNIQVKSLGVTYVSACWNRELAVDWRWDFLMEGPTVK